MTVFESIIAFDNNLFIAINNAHTPFFDLFFQTITFLGTGYVVAPVLLAIIFVSIPRKERKQIILCAVVSISVSGILTQGIKKLVHRPRPLAYFIPESQVLDSPDSGRPVYTVHVLGPRLKRNSFPSGHTSTAFAAATFLVLLYGGFFWSSYLIALFVAYSRIYLGVHFFLDTAAGAVLGIVVVWMIFKLFHIQEHPFHYGAKNDT
ncbi:MAG: phosphatase PAP2 family protein [Chitinispirillaceae bacterium]|nr:phosphatase PAP2 family protein [Chitinispirillaceae bacterium]